MFVTPFKLFIAVWLPGLFASRLFEAEAYQPISLDTFTIIGASAFVYAVAGIWRFSERARASPASCLRMPLVCALQKINLRKATQVIKILVVIWCIFYVCMIAYSGGVPFIWALYGDSRSYVDFGIPTVGGLCNMLRAAVVALSTLLLAHNDLQHRARRRLLLLIFLMLVSAFILEMARGNGVVLALHGLAYYFLARKIKFVWLGPLLIMAIGALIFLGYVQHLRYGDSWDKTFSYASNQGFEVNESKVKALLVPVAVYAASPAQNLELNVSISPLVSFNLVNSFQTLLPSVIRDTTFEKSDYGILVNESNNTTSAFTPLVRDFGKFGGALAGVLISLATSVTWIQASRGKLVYVLFWPPLFMSLVLSFFNLYFTSLIVVLYLPLAWVISRAIIAKARPPL